MNQDKFSAPLSLRKIQVLDPFWKKKMELVRKEVIPYQWEALNDKIEDAAPSYCMRNFKIAGKMNQKKTRMGASYEEPKYTFRGYEALPEDSNHLEDKFYGFVFQDSDFSKWIEAVGYSLTQHPDPELEKIADDAIDIVCAAQQDDGYLDTYYIINGKDKIFSNLRDHHELYCFGHLTEGAVAYFQATGKDKLLKTAQRFADYIVGYFGVEEGKCKGYPGHEIAEMALVRLYEVTGNMNYLNLSSFFIEQRGTKPYYFNKENHPKQSIKQEESGLRYAYNQAHLPVREQDEAVGHAVRAVYLYSGMADVARLTQDNSLYQACEKLWDDIVEKKMYITGGVGGTHIGEAFSFAYDLPNDTAYAETCASIGLVFFARRMLEIGPDAKYANEMERALYNSILSGIALDGKSFFYVNPLEVDPIACHKDERKHHVKPVRQKWFGCACCPPNIARLLSSIGSYAFTETEDTLFIHLYIGSTLTKKVNNKEVDICIQSGLPWDGEVDIKVRAKDTDFILALRLPDWCDQYQLEDTDMLQVREEDGYLYIKKEWHQEDSIRIVFPMEAKLMVSRAEVRENVGKAAVVRGPVVYCLEEVDNGKDLHLLSVKQDAPFLISKVKIGGVTVNGISTNGERIHAREKGSGIYHVLKPVQKQEVTLTYVPYFIWANRGENEMRVWTALTGGNK
jgi:DUF1680 family protein